jgi:predicted O-linked N-acetylglucosamine transferase (SPINDLY family)
MTMAHQRSPASQLLLNNSLSLFKSGKLDKAEEFARKVLAAEPRNTELLQFIAVLCLEQGKPDEAIRLCTEAVRLKPNSGEAHYNLGTALLRQQRHEQAIDSLRKSAGLLSRNYEALNNLSLALLGSGKVAEAEATARRAIAQAPRLAVAHVSLGLALANQARFADAVESLKAALARGPKDPGDVMTKLGLVLLEGQQPQAAIDCLGQVVARDAKSLAALEGLAQAELLEGRFQDAARHFLAATELAPDDARLLASLLYARLQTADWTEHAALIARLEKRLAQGAQSVNPFQLLALVDEPDLQRKAAAGFAARFAAADNAPSAPPPGATRGARPDRMKVAYLSSDFGVHATALLAAGLFEHHDRGRFEVTALAWDCDDSPMRRRLEPAFDRFVDIGAMPDAAVAQLIREHEIDIAVDLKGFTRGHRCRILAGRPAPIQVGYLGYPGTMGAAWIDYLIADRFVAPPEAAQCYSEKLVYLPDCYQVNDDKRAAAGERPERGAVGLPEQGFVFACFNNTYKITPDLFAIWMRLLEQAPGSVLWLLRPPDSREGGVAVANLRRYAGALGVAGERLVLAQNVPFAEHVRRLQCADLVLDTLPYNAHTTASDALWAGVPIVTCPGRSFQARVAGSLLQAMGLPELIAASLGDYEAIAMKLATDMDALAEMRSKVLRNRTTSALFDTGRFTRNLEAAYEAMWQLWREGQAPRAIDLAAST